MVQEHGLLVTKANLVSATVKSPACKQQTPTLSPCYATIPQTNWVSRMITLDHFHYGWENILFLDTCSVYLFALSVCKSSAITSTCGRRESLFPLCGIPNSLTSKQGTQYIENKGQQWEYVCGIHGIHWSCDVPHHPEGTGLAGWWDGFVNSPLQS